MSSELPQGIDTSDDSSQYGAVYAPLHVRREVKIYPIQEHELKTIGILNENFTTRRSIASGAAGLAFGVGWDMIITEGTTSLGVAVVVLCVAVIWICLSGSSKYRKEREDYLEKILGEVTPEER